MGCDIHLYAEKKFKGKWVCLNPLNYNTWGENPYEEREIESFNIGRNYTLFGFLAQVREEQEDGFEPKGFPEDASEIIKNIFESWGNDAHTPSFLTLKELKKRFKGKVRLSGMMNKDQWVKLQDSIKNGTPNYDLVYPYCKWGSDPNLIEFEIEVPKEFEFKYFYDQIIKDVLERHTWDRDRRVHDEESVRIVFWFDN